MKPQIPVTDDLYVQLTPALRALASRGVVRSYPKKTLLINEGDQGDSVFILLKGSVKVFSEDASGREITYGTIQAGNYFGEMSLDGGPRSASVVTLEACTCVELSRASLSDHLAADPQFALELVVQVIHRARAATEAARSMALLDVYGRLAAVLQQDLDDSHYQQPAHYQARPGPKTKPVCMAGLALREPHVLEPITHKDIAGRVGTAREAVSRILKELERGGYLTLSTKRITLLKRLPERY